MRHLILGSSGLVGSYLSKHIRGTSRDFSDVIEYDILRSPMEDLRQANSQNLYDKMNQADFVHFLACDIGGSEYMKKYQYSYDFISNNIKIMENTFDMLRLTGKPFYFASSQMSNMSHTTYGVLKHMGEYYTQSLNGIVVKFWNVYGEEHDESKNHVITDFVKSAKYDKGIRMRTNGKELRQFLYAEDCAVFLKNIAENNMSVDRCKPIHITSYQWVSILDLAKTVCKIYDAWEVIPGDKDDALQGGFKNEPDDYALRFFKDAKFTSLEEGIRKVGEKI